MNSLKSVLQTLCTPMKISGALIITKDGMVIESNLDSKYESETIGAFISQVVLMVKSYLAIFNGEEFSQYIMQSDKLKIYVSDLGASVLVTLVDIDSVPEDINVSLFQAANEIKKSERLEIK